LTRREKRIKECAKIIDDFTYEIIDRAQQRRRDDNQPRGENDKISGNNGIVDEDQDVIKGKKSSQRFDLLSSYIHTANKDDENLSKKELRDSIMTFIFAGRDNTARALTWVLYDLTKHPTVTNKVIEEIESKCGVPGDANSDFSFETVVNNLPYLHAVIMESQRLHPTVPENFRMAVKDDTLPDGTKILAKSCVMYSAYTMNHSELYWGDDADEFNPDRFMNRLEPSPYLFPIFNAGYRLCPGKPLALTEIKVTLARLLPSYEFVDAKNHTGKCRWTITMAMDGGFHVAVRRRENKAGSRT